MTEHLEPYEEGTPTAARPPWPQYPPMPPIYNIISNDSVNTTTVEAGLVAVADGGPNHLLHLILTVMTFGLWAPIWLLITVTHGTSGRAAAIIAGAVAGVVLLVLLASHPLTMLPVALVAGGGYAGYWLYQRAGERAAEEVDLAERAEVQNRAARMGHPRGTYGDFPPAPWPASTPAGFAPQQQQQCRHTDWCSCPTAL